MSSAYKLIFGKIIWWFPPDVHAHLWQQFLAVWTWVPCHTLFRFWVVNLHGSQPPEQQLPHSSGKSAIYNKEVQLAVWLHLTETVSAVTTVSITTEDLIPCNLSLSSTTEDLIPCNHSLQYYRGPNSMYSLSSATEEFIPCNHSESPVPIWHLLQVPGQE